MSAETLARYGMLLIAEVRIVDKNFQIKVTDESAVNRANSIYAFLIENEIVRIGSSKAILKSRLAAWQRDVSNALQGRKSGTPLTEAADWDALLRNGVVGFIYAREGSVVQTPIGAINAYLSEESALLGRHLPRMNRSKHR